jgi:Plasmid encoded RepA protein
MTDEPKQLSLIDRRLIFSGAEITETPPEEITYQHTVLCQTSLPYRDPGDAVREWKRSQGQVKLLVEAGQAIDPSTDDFVKLGLPFGPKPRLVLMHLNAQAIKTQSPVVEVESSMTAFAREVLGWGPNGREIRTMKDQLSRLASAIIRLGVTAGDRAFQVNTQIVTAFDLWFPKDDRQRVLWPSTVRLSDEYYQSLSRHAVPLDERAIAALAHSALSLDIYAWLSQRLYRIEYGSPQFVSWKALKEQFGWNYKRMNKFREVFLKALEQVHSQYRAGRFEIDGSKGMWLYNSPPPIKGRIFAVKALPEKK